MNRNDTDGIARPGRAATCRGLILSVRCLLLAFVLSWGSLAAWAGPPFATDDPEPVDYGHGEFYLASQNAKTADGWAGAPILMEINYGIVSNVQLHLVAPMAYDAPKHGTDHIGYGDTEMGAKYRFIEETPTRPQAGIFPMVEIPTGDADRNLGSGHLGAFLPLWLQKSWGEEDREWTAYGGGGYHINPGDGNRDWTFLGVLLQKQVTRSMVVGGEVYHRTPTATDDEEDTAFNIGTIINFGEHHHVLLSVGRSIDGPIDFQAYAAYQLTFGP